MKIVNSIDHGLPQFKLQKNWSEVFIEKLLHENWTTNWTTKPPKFEKPKRSNTSTNEPKKLTNINSDKPINCPMPKHFATKVFFKSF